MPASRPALRLSLVQARAHWMRCQGLAAPEPGAIDAIVAQTGWVRTLSGVDVYLATRARVPGMTRADLERASEDHEVQVLPSARGCIYLVPRAHAALALRLADDLSRKRTERDCAKVGLEMAELYAVGAAVVKALEKGPMTTDALRKALPDGVVRSLGDAGKKIGMSSTLPPAVRLMEFEGKLERSLEGGRLDTERYLWRLPVQNPFEVTPVSNDPTVRHARLAEIFYAQMGATTAKDFAEWSGLSQKEAKAAIAQAPLVPVAIEGYADEAHVLERDVPTLEAPASDRVVLLPGFDNLMSVHGGPGILIDPRFHGIPVDAWGPAKDTTLGNAKHTHHRPIVTGGQLIGFWEIDPDTWAVVAKGFEPFSKAVARAVEAEGEQVAAFLKDQIGHAKSYNLDTAEDQRKRIAFIKSL